MVLGPVPRGARPQLGAPISPSRPWSDSALFYALPLLTDPDWRQWAGALLLGGPAPRARDA